MNGLHFYAWYPDDHLPHALHLSLAEEGAYRRLLDACFSRGGRLPDDDNLLAKLIRCDLSSWQEIRKNLEPFFKISGGFWKQHRLSEEMKRAQHRRDAQVAAGQKTANNRWKDKRKTNDSLATSSPTSSATSSPTSSATSSASSSASSSATTNQSQIKKKEKENPPSGGQEKVVALPTVEPAPLEGEVLAPNGSTAKGSRLPADWQPDERDRQYASFRGLEPELIAESFRDYWHAQPGIAGRKTDWHATWRTWCRKEISYLSRRTLSPDRPSPRTVQTEAFYHAANDIERSRNC